MITSLKDFAIFEQKQKNAGTDIVICDVQESFKEFFGDVYVAKLQEFCQDYKRVYQIWDNHDATKPDYVFTNQVKAYEKHYGDKLTIDQVENFFAPAQWDLIKAKLHEIPNEGDKFDTIYGDCWVYIGNKHEWFLCPKDLFNLFKSFVTQERNIILCGGAVNECIMDIYVCMRACGVKVNYSADYLYSAKGSKYINETLPEEKPEKKSKHKQSGPAK